MTAAVAKPDPFEMSHDELALEVVQLRHFEAESKAMVRWMAEDKGLTDQDVNKLLAARLAKQGSQ